MVIAAAGPAYARHGARFLVRGGEIGEAEGKPMISISGTETYPVNGNLDMTTVYESGGPNGKLTFVDAIASWMNPSDAVVPRELLFPDEVSSAEVAQRNAMLQDYSWDRQAGFYEKLFERLRT